jgi:hypothetical protein
LLFAGLLLVPGIASLGVPIPQTETEGITVGNTNFGVQTGHSERVSPLISVALIAGGIALSMAGARARNGRAFLRGYFSQAVTLHHTPAAHQVNDEYHQRNHQQQVN